MDGRIAALGAAAALTMVWVAPGASQAEPQQLHAQAGAPLPLLAETTMNETCMAGEMPRARVVVGPAHGEVTVRSGQLRRADADCPPAPGYVLLYLPDSDFTGMDTISVEVVRDGEASTLDFEITIHGGQGTAEGEV